MKRSAPPVARRQLTRAHLAFYRAVIEGVDARRAWGQYLHAEGSFEAAACAALLAWVRQALIAEAMAIGQPQLIGLFRRDPLRMRAEGKPSLAEFSARYADAGDFSEAELLALWHEAHGSGGDRRSEALDARRVRLSRRLREALQLLEHGARKVPRVEDPVSLWLAPPVARRLADAGLHRLGDLQAALAARPRRRWNVAPGLGQVWADRLSAWLHEVGLPPRAAPAEDPALASPLRPLEHLLASPEDALRSDAQAIERWLQAHTANPHTARAYRRAAERLLLWCHHERRMALADITPADGIDYRAWLQEIGGHSAAEWSARGWRLPQAAWIGIRGKAREGVHWRPFGIGREEAARRAAALARGESPGPLLNAASVAQDLRVLRALWTFLRTAGVAAGEPWRGATGRHGSAVGVRSVRRLTQGEWQLVTQHLASARGERPARLRAAVWLAFACGLRPAEIIALRVGHLVTREGGWRLQVPGRGEAVPLPGPVRKALSEYLREAGVDLATSAPVHAGDPLLRACRRPQAMARLPVRPLGYKSLHDDVKRHLASCAGLLAARGDDEGTKRLRQASARWLRHTGAWLGLENGVLDTAAAQRLLGHRCGASLQPFKAAVPPDPAERVAAMASL